MPTAKSLLPLLFAVYRKLLVLQTFCTRLHPDVPQPSTTTDVPFRVPPVMTIRGGLCGQYPIHRGQGNAADRNIRSLRATAVGERDVAGAGRDVLLDAQQATAGGLQTDVLDGLNRAAGRECAFGLKRDAAVHSSGCSRFFECAARHYGDHAAGGDGTGLAEVAR